MRDNPTELKRCDPCQTSVQTEVDLRGPKTLDEAMQMAECADGIMFSVSREGQKGLGQRVPKGAENGPQPMELGRVEMRKKKPLGRVLYCQIPLKHSSRLACCGSLLIEAQLLLVLSISYTTGKLVPSHPLYSQLSTCSHPESTLCNCLSCFVAAQM